jgi:drug/metabolite transporter (DMT)-like permease
VLWSLSGGLTKLLTQPTPLDLNQPPVDPIHIAFFRVLFAGLVLAPTVRRADVCFRPALLSMAACFAIMNVLYVRALAEGSAANAILLQYTAPMWMYLASVFWLGEPAERRSTLTLVVGLVGIGVIASGPFWAVEERDRGANQLPVVGIALGSGLAYAGVLLHLRVLRGLSSRWLTVWNHLLAAVVLLPFVLRLELPTGTQLAVLFAFGAVQMGLPYWLVARGLRSVSPQEAGAITLLEPILNPVWAYLVSPETEKPNLATFLGGALILGGLVWRYSRRA